ncbi:hypothetical protein BCR42DRAFT_314949 [Absidia repens]|uniref:Oligomerization domain-domain-containing protein n=1 Tax=Absidia repens TaxID=90262 RepID=A0A1X2J2A3_9FUNG|nr:hypothetical protein BCR42DRAFT_314949 [Absidia repens]
MYRLRFFNPLLTHTLKQQQLYRFTGVKRILPSVLSTQKSHFNHWTPLQQTKQPQDTTTPPFSSTKEDEEEEDEETLDPKDFPELYPDEEGEGDQVIDTEWFVDSDYTESEDFVPMWQRQADAQQHLQDRKALQTLSEQLLKDDSLTPEMIQQVLEQAKMDNVLVMDVREKCDWTDYMIIAESAKGDKFLSSVAEHVGSTVRKAIAAHPGALHDLPNPHIEGRNDQSGWLLIDLGRCIVHLFTPEIRDHYDLEGLWKSVPTDPSLPMPDQP